MKTGCCKCDGEHQIGGVFEFREHSVKRPQARFFSL
jgi:hypothetical protein